MWARRMRTVLSSPAASSNATSPSVAIGCSNWVIW
jgi:hypothetical protein